MFMFRSTYYIEQKLWDIDEGDFLLTINFCIRLLMELIEYSICLFRPQYEVVIGSELLRFQMWSTKNMAYIPIEYNQLRRYIC